MFKCKKCNEADYLILQMAVNDFVCEGCGEWQDAVINDVWVRVA
jgi:hypothetical protein